MDSPFAWSHVGNSKKPIKCTEMPFCICCTNVIILLCVSIGDESCDHSSRKIHEFASQIARQGAGLTIIWGTSVLMDGTRGDANREHNQAERFGNA